MLVPKHTVPRGFIALVHGKCADTDVGSVYLTEYGLLPDKKYFAVIFSKQHSKTADGLVSDTYYVHKLEENSRGCQAPPRITVEGFKTREEASAYFEGLKRELDAEHLQASTNVRIRNSSVDPKFERKSVFRRSGEFIRRSLRSASPMAILRRSMQRPPKAVDTRPATMIDVTENLQSRPDTEAEKGHNYEQIYPHLPPPDDGFSNKLAHLTGTELMPPKNGVHILPNYEEEHQYETIYTHFVEDRPLPFTPAVPMTPLPETVNSQVQKMIEKFNKN